jgi:hypothetical protein
VKVQQHFKEMISVFKLEKLKAGLEQSLHVCCSWCLIRVASYLACSLILKMSALHISETMMHFTGPHIVNYKRYLVQFVSVNLYRLNFWGKTLCFQLISIF